MVSEPKALTKQTWAQSKRLMQGEQFIPNISCLLQESNNICLCLSNFYEIQLINWFKKKTTYLFSRPPATIKSPKIFSIEKFNM